MVRVIFQDGSSQSFDYAVSGVALANALGTVTASSAVAMKVNGLLKDLNSRIEDDSEVEFVMPNSVEGLEVIRHDAAHILAQAVKELFSETQVTIGPVIENGFYYDFARAIPFTTEDLVQIEKKMVEIIARDEKISRSVMEKSKAVAYFQSIGEHYKVELVNDIPEEQEISIYTQGDFTDLCRGPHSPSTGFVKAFKLMKISGSYWRGDSHNSCLQRIYGTAWASQEELNSYMTKLEEAEKRDHRKVGKAMDLFHFQDDAPGSVFWHPRGWKLFQNLINYIRAKQDEVGYLEINTPELMDKSLWEASGHWEKFGENMFMASAADEKVYAIKPMNCPGGVQVFKEVVVSYRDLPIKLSEFGKVHRYEPSGSLHGLMRVRAFTQDDAHIFCTEEQLNEESVKVCRLILEIYKDFGFEDVKIKFSDRPEKRIGSDDIWDRSEAALVAAVETLGLDYKLNPGEGAFYGPKLEFVLRDAIGRDWQIGTLQVDLNLPVRLGAVYTGADGVKHHPIMLHRAVFGSIERFTGVLLEHYAGKLPLWLSPLKVAILTITSDVSEYAEEVSALLLRYKIENIVDVSGETLNYKIKQHSMSKVPIIVVLGRNEAADRLISVRRLGSTGQKVCSLDDFLKDLLLEVRFSAQKL